MFDNAAALSAPPSLCLRLSTRRRFFPSGIRAFAHFPPSPFEKSRSLARSARVYDRNSFTRSSPVAQRNERCFFAWLIRGIKCARGLATGIRIFDPFFLSLYLCLSFFLPLPLCEHRSKRKARKTRLFTLEKNLTTTFTKRLRIYAGLKDETRFNPPALFPSRYSDG